MRWVLIDVEVFGHGGVFLVRWICDKGCGFCHGDLDG
jgi:hypothetical protein